ncbi:MAG: Na/Pi cotransporter family protein [Bacillaceae bacterium]|nr:Na/Pi cotransporter family protein [Bacillaceae bacterium]
MLKEILIPITVGLTLFLFGMQLMKIGLHNLAGKHIKSILASFSRTPLHSFVTGTLATVLLQSSSAVTLLTIGLTSSRILSFPQTVGIILGTNVGTTITTEIIALNITQYGLTLFLAGSVLWFVPHRALRCSGLVAAGFGSIFLGFDLLHWVAQPLRELHVFEQVMNLGSDNSVIGVLFGTVFTALIQSSTAVTAITMSFMDEHFIPLTTGIAIILGSNIGTCATAWLGSLGAGTEAKRVAWAHIILNVAGVILFIPLIGVLSLVSMALSPHPSAQLAHAQTLFNIACSLVALPFARPYAHLISRIIPGPDQD